jgi:hypothetical protein
MDTAPIKIVKNFLTEQEISSMIDYIDYLEKNKLEEFASDHGGKRLALQFGKELNDYYDAWTHLNLDLIAEKRDVLQDYFQRVVQETEANYDIPAKLSVCVLWIAKQYPGAIVEVHQDTDDGKSMHIKYSGIVYLNTMTNGGELHFEASGYSYKPEAGDLILFPSHEAGRHGVNKIDEVRYSFLMWMSYLDDLALS